MPSTSKRSKRPSKRPKRKTRIALDRLELPGGGEVEIRVRRSPRARRILLHVGSVAGDVELVLPRWASRAEGMSFAKSKTRWIERRLGQVLTPIEFEHGTPISILGKSLKIDFREGGRGAIARNGTALIVTGKDIHLPRRVKMWLRAEAAREIAMRVTEKARSIGRRERRIVIRDPRTRWGSCSPEGSLSFSWRLLLAPERVLDYVVAHEVAHLVHLHHGRRFWQLVDRLCDDAATARAWLRMNGGELHRYG